MNDNSKSKFILKPGYIYDPVKGSHVRSWAELVCNNIEPEEPEEKTKLFSEDENNTIPVKNELETETLALKRDSEDEDQGSEQKNVSLDSSDITEEEEPNETVYAYKSDELLANVEDFQICESKVQVADDSFIHVNFRGKRCIIETPIAVAVFGIKSYHNPGSKVLKQSLQLSLGSNGSKEMEDFRKLLYKIDEWAKPNKFQEHDVYTSAIRSSKKHKKKPPALRIKIPSFGNKTTLDLIDSCGKLIRNPSPSLLKRLIPHGTQVKCIIAVNPLWRANKKYGISYKLMKLKIKEPAQNVQFRDN